MTAVNDYEVFTRGLRQLEEERKQRETPQGEISVVDQLSLSFNLFQAYLHVQHMATPISVIYEGRRDREALTTLVTTNLTPGTILVYEGRDYVQIERLGKKETEVPIELDEVRVLYEVKDNIEQLLPEGGSRPIGRADECLLGFRTEAEGYILLRRDKTSPLFIPPQSSDEKPYSRVWSRGDIFSRSVVSDTSLVNAVNAVYHAANERYKDDGKAYTVEVKFS